VGPVFIGILGYGNVSKGAQHIFECFPHEYIAPEELVSFAQSGQAENNKIYLTVFKEEHLVEHKEGKKFQLQDYYDHPENYQSQFKQYLPHLTILVTPPTGKPVIQNLLPGIICMNYLAQKPTPV
jgi:alpha-aminoadipic semialdehyde synthase